VTLHSKMLHKTQSHCSPNLIFAGVLNNSYMYTIYIFSRKIKILHFEKYKVKGLILRPCKKRCAEYIGFVGHSKGHFIGSEMGIK
jgi:hypothetical protein